MKAELDLSDFRATDREECGVIIKKGKKFRAVKVRNIAADPENDYAISMVDFETVNIGLGPGEKIVGFIHTHLEKHEARPTKADIAGARIFPGFVNLVYKPSTGEKVWYTSDGVARDR